MVVVQYPGPRVTSRNFRTVAAPTGQSDPSHTIVRVSVISPSWAWRRGVRGLIEERLPHLVLTCHAETTPPAVDLHSTDGQAVLLDGAMDQALIFEWIFYWREINSDSKVLVLDAVNHTDTLLAYFAAGGAGYTSLGDDESVIIATLEDLQKGIAHCSPDLIARLLAPSEASRIVAPLSPRELEVLEHIARNLSNQEIADTLVVELSTIKHHVHNILQKLNVRHRWEAVHLATSEGWLYGP